MADLIQLAQDTASAFAAIIPEQGEAVYLTDEKAFVIGDGTSTVAQLARFRRGFHYPMAFHGDAIDETIFGYFYAEAACSIIGALIFAQDAPTGAALTIDLVNGAGTEQSKVATLADGATKQRTAFGSALAVAVGDVIQAKIKSIGSTLPGQNLTFVLIVK